MKKLLGFIFFAILLTFTSCSNQNLGILEPIPSGTYSYTSYDTTGTAIVSGLLFVNYTDSFNITGQWNLRKIGEPQNIGPQVGNGNLEGSIRNGKILFELNPKFRDNNLGLIGTMKNNIYKGIWQWISIVGVSNHGTFEAINN